MITEKALSKYVSIFKHKLGIQARLRGKLSLILSKTSLLKEEAHDLQIETWEPMLKWSFICKVFTGNKTWERSGMKQDWAQGESES